MKFMNGCGGKILTIILSIILGVILTLGGIAGAGYILLTKKGMLLKAEEYAKSKDFPIDFDDKVANGTILEWGKSIASILKNSNTNTIGEMESVIGFSILSNTLSQVLGIEPATFKAATFDNLGETISSNLTMSLTRDKFGITFPDMPIFADEEFLAKPLGEAFKDFDSYPLGDVIKIESDAHAALKALSQTPIKEIGSAAAVQKINALSLCELMTINESSSATLKALKYNTIDSTYEYHPETNEILVDENGRFVYKTKTLTVPDGDGFVEIEVEMQGISDRMKELKVSEVVEITSQSNAVLRKMRVATQQEKELIEQEDIEIYVKNYIKELYTESYPNAFDAVIIAEYGGVDQETVDLMPLEEKEGFLYHFLDNNRDNKIYCYSYNQLISLACGFGAEDLLIEQLGGSKFNDIVDNTTMGEFITITEESQPILKALQNTKIKNLNVRIQTLQLNEIFEADKLSSGALALIEPTTILSDIPNAMSDAIKDSTIATLKGRGVIAEDKFVNIGNANVEQQSYIYNSSVGEFLGGIIDFIANPIDTEVTPPVANFHHIQLEQKVLTGTPVFNSLTAFVAEYNQYNSLLLDGVVTINIDEELDSQFFNADQVCYLIPVFSLDSSSTINFSQQVKLAVYNKIDVDAYQLSKHQFAYFYTPSEIELAYIDTIIKDTKN